ncbi:hypothetical protein RF11_00528 [Thelohanellus kitauei]|uniref:Uncharacterized protein n=1 Tax=Thelohanellus kitauei TaxID=669202 RepID=A0A0C2NL72_THEKT|nr:hypothetical protein RF11_00528 [Thelohanellus kitauei]
MDMFINCARNSIDIKFNGIDGSVKEGQETMIDSSPPLLVQYLKKNEYHVLKIIVVLFRKPFVPLMTAYEADVNSSVESVCRVIHFFMENRDRNFYYFPASQLEISVIADKYENQKLSLESFLNKENHDKKSNEFLTQRIKLKKLCKPQTGTEPKVVKAKVSLD